MKISHCETVSRNRPLLSIKRLTFVITIEIGYINSLSSFFRSRFVQTRILLRREHAETTMTLSYVCVLSSSSAIKR